MMMLIGDPPRSNTTVQISPCDNHQYIEDLTAHIHSPLTNNPDALHYENAFTALQRYLPSNINDVVQAEDEDSDDFDLPVDAFSCDDFRMFEFKVKQCSRARSHDWTECPYAHPGEKARRRDPRKYHYSGSACPDFRKGACLRGDACEYAHGVFECWLHPARYRTLPCKDGIHCRRRVCFFAHTPDQIRVLPDGSPKPDPVMLFGSSPKSTLYSPPSSPITSSPPASPSQLTESMYGLRINEMKMSIGMRLSVSPPSWTVGSGLTRSPPAVRSGFMSLPSTPIRAVSRSGLGGLDLWDQYCKEEPMMERVESGRELRERIYAKLGRENSLDRVGRGDSVPDIGWVSELIN
ncbi:hypothetical protein ACJIZ3_001619 [Penstemon smallii]|uniref:C3H1-type domain-containing protein n=1 Tax=Penstemon smallii TaxID=265156 RepID=A0ABD3U5W9_9LAMI